MITSSTFSSSFAVTDLRCCVHFGCKSTDMMTLEATFTKILSFFLGATRMGRSRLKTSEPRWVFWSWSPRDQTEVVQTCREKGEWISEEGSWGWKVAEELHRCNAWGREVGWCEERRCWGLKGLRGDDGCGADGGGREEGGRWAVEILPARPLNSGYNSHHSAWEHHVCLLVCVFLSQETH